MTTTTNQQQHNEATGATASASATTTAPAAVATAGASPTSVGLHNSSNNGQSTLPLTITTNRVMQADEDFNIRFVNLVRTHKCLYDKKVPEYRNRDNQEKAWVLISKETRESVIHCKERWRNLRACLSRYIKQQSGSEPQHKPYYLTEHMAFLLPFLKSTRNSLDGNSTLATLYQLSQQHQEQKLPNLYNNNLQESFELKQSLSENDDEETIDAFDPAIAASLGLQRVVNVSNVPCAAMVNVPDMGSAASPAHSDTASANTMQNFIPDVQLAESPQGFVFGDSHSTPLHGRALHELHYESSNAKRIKTECEATTTSTTGLGYHGGMTVTEHTDMEFFRSILPDIAALTPQQRRKFKIGILELIDDVVERYPSAQERYNGGAMNGSGSSSGAVSTGRQQRRSSAREWRK